MLRLNHFYTGLDVQRTAIAKASAYYGDHFICGSIESFSAKTDETFDIIYVFDVIEHINQPREFINASLSLLRVDGKMIVTTPDGDQMNRREWSTDLPPIHVSVFKRQSFKILHSNSLRVGFIGDMQPFPSYTNVKRA